VRERSIDVSAPSQLCVVIWLGLDQFSRSQKDLQHFQNKRRSLRFEPQAIHSRQTYNQSKHERVLIECKLSPLIFVYTNLKKMAKNASTTRALSNPWLQAEMHRKICGDNARG
jgi:hypothetical protein